MNLMTRFRVTIQDAGQPPPPHDQAYDLIIHSALIYTNDRSIPKEKESKSVQGCPLVI